MKTIAILIILCSLPAFGQMNMARMNSGSSLPGSCVASAATNGPDLFWLTGSSAIYICGPTNNNWILYWVAPVGATFSAAATSGTITHNFGSATHTVSCTNSSNAVVIPSAQALGSNSDTISFAGGLAASTTCVAVR